MAIPKLYNLARMTTATTGTGTVTLGSAVSGYLSFALSGVANAETVRYAIKDGANSEIGLGTYTSAGTTLSRTVEKSTNSDALISLSGTAEIFITPDANDIYKKPTQQLLTSGTGATYTTPAGCKYIRIRAKGAGGGGGGGAGSTGGGNGGDGGATSFGSTPVNAVGGAGGVGGGGSGNIGNGAGSGAGGAQASCTGDFKQSGDCGGFGAPGIATFGQIGGQGGGTGGGKGNAAGAGTAGSANSGGGGGGGASAALSGSGAGGGEGALVEHVIETPAATYLYTIGAGGTAGTTGTGGAAGAAGGSGWITVDEFYN